MKKIVLTLISIFTIGWLSAQTHPYFDVSQIGFVDSTTLANCLDTALNVNDGDTIRTRGIVVTDGNLSEVTSSSVTGGSRPFITIADTANNGAAGPWNGVVVMGVFWNTSDPVSDVENAVAGDIIEMTAAVNVFNGLIQLQPINSSSISIIGATTPPTFTRISAGDIQDDQRLNILTTGEQWEGSYVELINMTVVAVNPFNSGKSRFEFTIQDSIGNQVLVADRFLPMILDGVGTVNANSPDTAGSLIGPAVGTKYNHVRGVIFHDNNGCANATGTGSGYEINPVYDTDFDIAPSPPVVINVSRTIVNPNATESVDVSADLIDFDGAITAGRLFYSADPAAPANLFTSVSMTNTSGNTYTGTIPAFPLDSMVRYYIEADDDSSNTSTFPPNDPFFYFVRANGTTIRDIQWVPSNASSDASPLEGDTVTVTGIVTGSFQPNDIGLLYIQDSAETEFAAVFINTSDASVLTLNRGDEVTVRGAVTERFGFTQIDGATVTATGNTATVNPVVIDPSDTNLFGSSAGSRAMERYESMLLRYENPAGKVHFISSLGFGEYSVGSGKGATPNARVLAGRNSAGSAQGSINVSYIADTATYGSGLNVTPVQVDTSFTMDHLDGILYYAFGNYKLAPRNNADFLNPSIIVSLNEIFRDEEVGMSIYPNPTKERLTIQLDDSYQFDQLIIQVLDINGRQAIDTKTALKRTTINMGDLDKGVYIVRVSNGSQIISTSKVILQ